jgi:LmbE family N-acetylglucosaminyl deacetylase
MPTAFAIAAHPDDIEIFMGGTMLPLKQAGWETHYMNLSSGNCGSMTMDADETRRVRAEEARNGAAMLGATFHPSLADDLEIMYDTPTIRRLAAVVREVDPDIVLTHSPDDYMEDHMNASRLAVTATFARFLPNYETLPPSEICSKPATVYHAMPHGLRTQLRQPVVAEIYVDTSSVNATKREALAAHASQKSWLDATQGMDSYLDSMEEMAEAVGALSGRYTNAEGWRRHTHWGLAPVLLDPLSEALANYSFVNPDYAD